MAALDNPRPYEIVNIGGSNTIEVNRLIELIETNLGKKADIRYGDIAPGDVPITYADATRAERLLGFKAKVRIDEGVGRYVRWFLEREERLSGV